MRHCGPVLITSLKQQGQTHLALWRLHSDNPYNNKIHQTSYNPVTFAELIYFLLFSLSLCLCLSLFRTKGFEQLRVSWLYASNHSHVYRFSRIRESTSDSFSLDRTITVITTHTVCSSVVLPLLLPYLIIFSCESWYYE